MLDNFFFLILEIFEVFLVRNDKLFNTSVCALLVLWCSWEELRYCVTGCEIRTINCEVCTVVLKLHRLSTPTAQLTAVPIPSKRPSCHCHQQKALYVAQQFTSFFLCRVWSACHCAFSREMLGIRVCCWIVPFRCAENSQFLTALLKVSTHSFPKGTRMQLRNVNLLLSGWKWIRVTSV